MNGFLVLQTIFFRGYVDSAFSSQKKKILKAGVTSPSVWKIISSAVVSKWAIEFHGLRYCRMNGKTGEKNVYSPISKDAFIASLYKLALNAQWAFSCLVSAQQGKGLFHCAFNFSLAQCLSKLVPGQYTCTYQMCLPGHRCANWEFPCSSCRPPKCSALEGQKGVQSW